jgi:hypothetical protein
MQAQGEYRSLKREGEVREAFISNTSFLVEADVNTSVMQSGSNNESRHDIGVVNLVGMD